MGNSNSLFGDNYHNLYKYNIDKLIEKFTFQLKVQYPRIIFFGRQNQISG